MALRYRCIRQDDLFPDSLPCTDKVWSYEQWTEDDIHHLRSWVMRQSLAQLLDGRVSADIRIESLDWIMSDAIEPFSFRVCCMEECVDPEELRERLQELLLRHPTSSPSTDVLLD